jgi:hypothetical protein
MKDCGKNQVSVGITSGNSMVQGQVISSTDGRSRYQKVDAIGQVGDFKVEKKLGTGDCVASITVSARTIGFTGGDGAQDPLTRITGDQFIEAFHSHVLNANDPYLRKKLGMDQLHALLVDRDGHNFSLNSSNEGDYWVLPIRVSYDQYKRLTDTANSKTTLNYGVQAQIPVQQPFGQAAVGVHSNITHTDRISDNYLVSYAAGLAMNIQTTVGGGYDPSDSKFTPTYNGTVAMGLTRIDKDGKGRTSYLVTLEKNNALLNRSNYSVAYPQTTKWLSNQSLAAETDSEYALGLIIRRQSGNTTNEFMCKEDYNSRLGRGFNGNNNQDWFCGVRRTVQY